MTPARLLACAANCQSAPAPAAAAAAPQAAAAAAAGRVASFAAGRRVRLASAPWLPLQVYKLYGGPHGFMVSTGVAEPDADHAATLLRFSLHLLQATASVRRRGPRACAGPRQHRPLQAAAGCCGCASPVVAGLRRSVVASHRPR